MKICFFGNISGALNGKTIGGGELQIALLARSLAKAGNEIIIVDPYNNEELITDEGIRVITVPDWNAGFRIARMFSHRIPALLKILKLQRADVYYIRMRSFYNFLPYLAAKAVNAKFVFAVASDLDILGFPDRFSHHYIKSMHWYDWIANALPTELVLPYLLRHADIILTQHEMQKKELDRKNIPSIIFQNLIDIQSILSNSSTSKREGYAYVGAIDPRKGFSDFIAIAETVKSKFFKAIGEPRGKGAELLCKRFRQLPNVKMLGYLSHKETIQHIANSEALICTSAFEGFPNTFLEAWCLGTPVISLSVDPGGVIERERLGLFCRGDLKELIKAVTEEPPHCDPELLHKYVRSYHSYEGAANRFLSIVNDLGLRKQSF
ncbi:MAG: glycosyltransferase family 4 protein [Bacteroidota bacterium]